MEFTVEQQAEIDRIVGEAQVKARNQAKNEYETAQAKAQEVTEQANLAAQNKWQQIAEGLKARVATLEPLEQQIAVYQESFEGMLKDKIKVLGDGAKQVLDTLPASMTAVEKLAWLSTNEGLFAPGNSVGTPNRSAQKQKSTVHPTVNKFPIKL